MTNNNALDVAKFIINYCNENGKPVNILKLNKMLYFMWADYYRDTGLQLFSDNFYAWRYGPVVPCVYFEFNYNSAGPISRIFKHGVSPVLQSRISKYIEKYIDESTFNLIEKSMMPGRAWDTVYKNKTNKEEVIPCKLIIRLDCNN